MKFKNLILSFLLVLFLGVSICLVGCGENNNNTPPAQEQPPVEEEPIETTFDVHISLNNSSYGSIIIDNLKTKYNDGDRITVRVAPNEGFYLRGYSDCDSKDLTREITVTKSEDITVNLVEGEACTFYGYHIAANSPIEQKILGATEKTSIYQGGITQFVKYLPNKNITSGNLALLAQDRDNFGCWEIKQANKTTFESNPDTTSKIFDFLITEEYLSRNFGDNKTDWIDITEHDTYCGNAYALFYLDSKDDACYIKIPTEFNPELFVKTEIHYIYSLNGNLTVEGFEKDGNIYKAPHFATNNKLCGVQSFRLFTINDTLFYTANTSNYMLKQDQTYTKEITFDGNTYTIQFAKP